MRIKNQREIREVSENNSNDMIYNWRNELRSNNDGVLIVANSQAQKYKNQGFNKSEVVELLAADNFDLDVANRIASKLFDSAQEVEQNTAIEVAVIPTRYSDCAPVIERSLTKFSAKEFVKRLCGGPHSIVKTDEKGLGFWLRITDSASGKNHLHASLRPYIEETLLNNVLLAQSQEAQIKTASKTKFVVSMKKGSAEVDLSNATSSSDKFIGGNYVDFGLADEFMVKAADTVSPYQRLKRALRD
jgi:GTPase SAR1 family protein